MTNKKQIALVALATMSYTTGLASAIIQQSMAAIYVHTLILIAFAVYIAFQE